MDLSSDFAEYHPTVPEPSNDPSILSPMPVRHAPFIPFAYPSASTDSSRQDTPISIWDHSSTITSAQATIPNTRTALALAFAGSQIFSRLNGTNTAWQIQCPDCSTWVSTGVPSDMVLGDTEGHFASLAAHRGGKKCVAEWLKASSGFGSGRLDSSSDGVRGQFMQPPPRTMTAPPDSASSGRRTELVWLSQAAHDFDNAYTGYARIFTTRCSYLITFFYYSLTNAYSLLLRHFESVIRPDSAPPDVPDAPQPACPGVSIHWPPALDIYDTFPWSRLGPTAGQLRFPFHIEVQGLGRRFVAHSHLCAGTVEEEKVPCLECQAIAARVTRVVSAASAGKVPHKTVTFSPKQLRNYLQDRIQTLNQWKLKVRNLGSLSLPNITHYTWHSDT